MKNLLYHLKNIRHYYDSIKALDIDDLKIKKGSITALIGPNGSGKTTLLKLLAFAQIPTQGQIFYKGQEEFLFSSIVRSKVTLLTQKPYLLKRTVFENIAYGLKIRKDKNHVKERVKKALLNVGLDYQGFAGRQWHELSGGEAKRVAMAARLVFEPEVLLLDEPIASVDTESAKLIRHASLKARDARGTTLVIASHDLEWLYSISDKQFFIFKGKVFTTGMENIITGPFQRFDQAFCEKKLDDKQSVYLKTTQKKTCAAIIKKKNILLNLKKQSNNDTHNQLSGHITSMFLEKKNKSIMVIVTICDLSFALRLTPDRISNLYPGKKVVLMFHPDDVEWI